jgi:hypothetical protein
VAPCTRAPGYGEDDLIAVLSRHGADKVLLSTAPEFGGAPRWGSHGPLVAAACAQLPPSLLLLAATDGARDLGPRVAAQLGAAFLADAWAEVGDDGLKLFDGSGDGALELEGELEFPVVAVVPAGRYATREGDEEAEVEMFEPRLTTGATFEELDRAPDRPRAIVCGSAATDDLARALDGEKATLPGGHARLAVALDDETAALGQALAGVRAQVKVALGAGAATCAAARYAVEGEAERLAPELARAIAALPPEPPPAAEEPAPPPTEGAT